MVSAVFHSPLSAAAEAAAIKREAAPAIQHGLTGPKHSESQRASTDPSASPASTQRL